MKKVIILGGGISPEREISLTTADTVKSALESLNIIADIIDPAECSSWNHCLNELIAQNPDMVFLALHGAAGEDGRLQSALELAGIPFTGSGSHASALAMDKNAALCLAAQAGIKVAKRVTLFKFLDFEPAYIIDSLGFPLVIKPNSSGSSVGISIIKDKDQLKKAIEHAFEHDDIIICESFIKGRELTVSIIDDSALPVVEIRPRNGWYDYHNKYTHGNTEYLCPAPLSKEETSFLQALALKIFHILRCQVYARIDFRYDGSQFYFLEVNTLPGMTALSLTPMAAKASGLSLAELINKIIILSKLKK